MQRAANLEGSYKHATRGMPEEGRKICGYTFSASAPRLSLGTVATGVVTITPRAALRMYAPSVGKASGR